MAKKATTANTGLTLTRSDTKFSASWKIKASKVKWQKVRYRTHNGVSWGDWTTDSLSKSATSSSFTLSASDAITQVQVQTQIRQKSTKKTTYTASKWSSSSFTYVVEAPPTPTLTTTKESANATKFEWSVDSSSTESAWYYKCLYRTKCDDTPDASTGWTDWTDASSSSYSYTDTTLGTTRIFQIKAIGPGGESDVITGRHIIDTAPVATWGDPAVVYAVLASYYQLTYNVNLTGSANNVDTITPQYLIDTPSSSVDVPSGASWSDGTTYNYSDGNTEYTFAATTTELIGADECLWARIKTEHDSVDSYSDAVRVITGALTTPTLSFSMGTISSSGFSVTITVSDAGTDVPGTYMEVYLERYSNAGKYILIGTIPNGASSATITSTEDISSESGYALHVRNVTADGVTMVSDFADYSSSMPSAPTLDAVTPTSTSGKVYVTWTNNWSDATGTIIAWTEDPDAWMSNEEPDTYEVTERGSAWFITGLSTGTTWYFRVRSVYSEDDDETLSPWSDMISIDLSSAPAVPTLYLSDEVITEDGMVTAYWSYVSTDGTAQVAGNVVEATYSNGAWSYGDALVSTSTAQHIDIYAEQQGWSTGDVIYLALQTQSGSGGVSEYSTPVQLVIADTPTVTVQTTSLVNSDTLTEYFMGDAETVNFVCVHSLSASPTATVDGDSVTVSGYTDDTVTLTSAPDDGAEIAITYTTTDEPILDEMPLTATVTTTGATTLTTILERAESYPMVRPDESSTDGTKGETIYVNTGVANASNSISIDMENLIGRIDDGAYYNLIFEVTDAYGQTATADAIRFRVHWSHQSWVPTAAFWSDYERYAAHITPIAGDNFEDGDTCNIYRLGFDKPELIIEGGEFGETYVDPFPAFGEYSGYKVVTVTRAGDYITDDNTFAEYDSTVEGGYPQMDPQMIVFDFEDSRIELPYNISMSNSWAKDFERTAYLGGHVVGDYNKAVTRDLTVSTVLVRPDDGDMARLVRDLARYAGRCHVRTPEGSSFEANVSVSEDASYETKKISYSLAIQKVDTTGMDGMTLADWKALL